MPDSPQRSIVRLAICGSRSAHAANPSGGNTLPSNVADFTLLGILGHSVHCTLPNVTDVALGIIRCGTADDLHSNGPEPEASSKITLVFDASIEQCSFESGICPENFVLAMLKVVSSTSFESPEGRAPDN